MILLSSISSVEAFVYCYYEDDTNNTLLWELGKSGSIVKSTLDVWDEIYLTPIYIDTNVKVLDTLTGTKYKKFRAGTGSSYSSYNGLTVVGTVGDDVLPTVITAEHKLPGTDYTTLTYALPGQPLIWILAEDEFDIIYAR